MSFFFHEVNGRIEPEYDVIGNIIGCFAYDDDGYIDCTACRLVASCPARKEAMQ